MILAIDVGGTKTLLAVFDDNKKLVEQVKFPTPKDYSEFIKSINEAKEKLTTKRFFAGAVGIRGLVDRRKGILITDSILDWHNAPLAKDLSEIFSCGFSVENDSKLAGLSEATLPNNAKYKKITYITISTGIGSVFIVDKKIDTNLVSSEIGKWVFEHDNKFQTWENFASGKAIVDKYKKRASELEDETSWKSISKNMAIGILNASAAYTPDLIIIGGGVGEHFTKFEKPLLQALQDFPHESIIIPKIIGAERSEEAVIYGCLELALQKI